MMTSIHWGWSQYLSYTSWWAVWVLASRWGEVEGAECEDDLSKIEKKDMSCRYLLCFFLEITEDFLDSGWWSVKGLERWQASGFQFGWKFTPENSNRTVTCLRWIEIDWLIMIWTGFLQDKKPQRKGCPPQKRMILPARFLNCKLVFLLWECENTEPIAGNFWYPAQKYKTPCSCDHPWMNKKKCGLEPSGLARPSCLVPFCSLASLHLGRCLVEVDLFVCCTGFVACRMVPTVDGRSPAPPGRQETM